MSFGQGAGGHEALSSCLPRLAVSRAAAVDQLQEWTDRSGVDIHRPKEGQTKPGPVLEDALDRAIKGNYDVVRPFSPWYSLSITMW
jgi:signal recognition particle GTPase